MRTVSFVIRKPKEETGMALSHAPDSLQDTAKSLARDLRLEISYHCSLQGWRPSVIRSFLDPRLFANGMMEILVGPLLQLAPLSRRVEQHLVLGIIWVFSYYYYIIMLK